MAAKSMKDLMALALKTCDVKEASVMSESKFFSSYETTRTTIPAINIALSGAIDGGFASGLATVAGPSKHFKTSIVLLIASAYLKKHEDAIIVFFDSEFGASLDYFRSFGIDPTRVVHIPMVSVEELRSSMLKLLEGFQRGDKVFFMVDSIGNLASNKETNDALADKDSADMTRAKTLKSFGRIITPRLRIKDLPCFIVGHTYDTMEMYSKKVLSGGTGIMYSSGMVIFIGRQQEKADKEVLGYNFILTIEKSRFVREQSKIPLEVRFDGGISKWSGLIDIAMEAGFVTKPKVGWYARSTPNPSDGGDPIAEEKLWRLKDTNCSEFWKPILQNKDFSAWIENKYRIAQQDMISDEELDAEAEAAYADAMKEIDE